MSGPRPAGPVHLTPLPPGAEGEQGGRRFGAGELREASSERAGVRARGTRDRSSRPTEDAAAGIDVRLAVSRSVPRRIELLLGGRNLGPPRSFIDEHGIDVLRWRLPADVDFDATTARLAHSHDGEPLTVARWQLLDAGSMARSPRPVSPAERSERRRRTVADLRSSIDSRRDGSDLERRARLFFLDLNCQSQKALVEAMLPVAEARDRVQAIDAMVATLLHRLQRRFERAPDLGPPPPDRVRQPVAELVAGLLRTHFPGARAGVEPTAVLEAFTLFAAGRLDNAPHPGAVLSNGVPNGAMIFLFAELADLECGPEGSEGDLWAGLLPAFAACQRVFLDAHQPRRRSFNRYEPAVRRTRSDAEVWAAAGTVEPDVPSARLALARQVEEAFTDGWYA